MTSKRPDNDRDIIDKEEGEIASDDDSLSRNTTLLTPNKRQRSPDRSNDSRSKTVKVDERPSSYKSHPSDRYHKGSQQRRYESSYERDRDQYRSRQRPSNRETDQTVTNGSKQAYSKHSTTESNHHKTNTEPMDIDNKANGKRYVHTTLLENTSLRINMWSDSCFFVSSNAANDDDDDIELKDEDEIKAEEEKLIEERRKRRQAILQKYQSKTLQNVTQVQDRAASMSDNDTNIGKKAYCMVLMQRALSDISNKLCYPF